MQLAILYAGRYNGCMAKRSVPRQALPDRVSLWLATHLRNVGGALLIGLAVAFAAWATIGSLPLSGLRQDVIESLGGGVYLVALAVALAGALLGMDRARQRVRRDRRLVLRCVGSILALLALWGVAGAISLEQSLGGVSLSRYGAGGRVGGWLDSPIGWLVIVAALGVAFVLIAPGTTRRMVRRAGGAIEDGLKQLGHEIREKGPLALASLARGLWLGFVWLLDQIRLMLLWICREVWEAIGTIRNSDRADAQPPLSRVEHQSTPRLPSDEGMTFEHLPTQPEEAWPPLSDEPDAAAQTDQPQPPAGTSKPQSLLRTLDRTATDGWRLPPIELLDEDPASTLRSGADEHAAIIIATLASFGVDARVTQINEGPAITQFGVEPGWEVKTRQVAVRDSSGMPVVDEQGQPVVQTEEVSRTRVRVNRITRLADDLALALAAPSIRIEAPVPGQPIVGVEVPNADRRIVALRGLIESDEFAAMASKEGLPIALGRDVRGNPVIADLTQMPHVLIAGATGSGKSVCINTIISSLLMQKSPEEVRLILVDPKRVELTNYGRAPHLAFSHVVTEPDEVVSVLGVVVTEMERRYRQLEEHQARNIIAFNQLEHISRRMPYWVVVLDELADMMMAAAADVEGQLVRLAQLARAVGIHLVVATQRPSVDVVTGLIKANFPTRIAFATTSQTDARVILDRAGAEKLMGRGDMLYMSSDSIKSRRVQGAFVSDAEIERILDSWTGASQAETEQSSLDEMLEALSEESPAALVEAEARAAQAELDSLTETLETVLESEGSEEAPDIVMEADPPQSLRDSSPLEGGSGGTMSRGDLPMEVGSEKAMDSRLGEATELAREYERVSAMLLQRRMRIGRPRAERLIEQLTQTGVIEEADGGRSRRVLLRNER